eukprot:CAMPEP_0175072340 /NCGR_PEP_ID=MMETSP0052_2-20121109/19843_1 /TAXON_ID=51329 ORGANISM="Polytomella parva, Strain SAG 63-3" /NCGR_SAMPLE_ID=MMETSP0052_2 /ASSEMBLY_ACC=CAM_ASM_000194 /LENGTH=252 /DNA_ID=CAMNT_0016339809 /DNA_START=183 /DNA_END=937 /DNA_ORIENTATION=+
MSNRQKNPTAKPSCNCSCKGRCKYPDWCEKCGVIKCRPEIPTNWADGTLNSSYREDYYKKNGAPSSSARSSLPSKRFIPEMLPLSDATTFRTDFGPKTVDHPGRRPGQSPLPLDPFLHQSTYSANYPRHPLRSSVPSKPPAATLNLPLDGQSSYKADYPSFPAGSGSRTPFDPNDARGIVPAPFDGLSEYKDKYLPVGADYDRRRSLKPDGGPFHSLSSTPNSTLSGDDFRKWPLASPSKPRCCENQGHKAV